MSNIEVIKLSEYVRPTIKESSQDKWVLNGVKNSFYQEIIDGYNNSPTNAAITSSYSLMTYGLGLNQQQNIISKSDLRKVCADLNLFGEASVEIQYKNKKAVKIYHVAKNKVVPSKQIDGEIKSWWYCEDWSQPRKYQPIEFDTFGFGNKSKNEIHVIRDYAFGQFYFANPQYLAALPYIQLENELSNYFVNHVKNGFSAGHVINMNMQEPDDEMKGKIVADIKRKLTGSSNAGEVIVSFNSSKEYNTTVERIEVSDAHSQYDWLCEFARDQICVAHKVISGAILGIAKGTGFSSNAEEIETAFNETMINIIKPKQELICDELERIIEMQNLAFIPLRQSMSDEAQGTGEVATPTANVTDVASEDLIKKEASYNGAQIASSLDIMQAVKDGVLTVDQAITFLIQMLQFDPSVAKALFSGNSADAIAMSKEKKKHNHTHETDGIADALIDLGEEVDIEEWEVVLENDLEGVPENIDAKLNLSASIILGDLEMARDFASFWKDGSEQDTSLFKVRYKYAGNPKPQREFCQKVMKANKVYRKEDIDLAGDKVVNPGLGAKGADKYSIWLFKGGLRCQHVWQRVIYLRKGNNKISVNQARKMILELEPELRDKARWVENDPRVAQAAAPENNFWAYPGN